MSARWRCKMVAGFLHNVSFMWIIAARGPPNVVVTSDLCWVRAFYCVSGSDPQLCGWSLLTVMLWSNGIYYWISYSASPDIGNIAVTTLCHCTPHWSTVSNFFTYICNDLHCSFLIHSSQPMWVSRQYLSWSVLIVPYTVIIPIPDNVTSDRQEYVDKGN